jgi:hypothetical protein
MELQEWRVVAASSLGASHLKTEAPCQDAHAWDLTQDNQTIVLVAADGAGSASHSDTGSQLATSEILDSIRSFFDDGKDLSQVTREVANEWLRNAAERISERAKVDDLPVREYACTLLAAIVSSTHTCFIQVGDGAIVIRPRGDDWAYVFWPQHGEYINTTVFITDPAAVENFEFSCQAGFVDEVAAFTDGIEALVLHYATQTVHAPFFDQMFKPVRALEHSGFNEGMSAKLEAYLSSPLICDRTDDDKTLLLASRLAKPPVSTSAVVEEGA